VIIFYPKLEYESLVQKDEYKSKLHKLVLPTGTDVLAISEVYSVKDSKPSIKNPTLESISTIKTHSD
jgi:hypothetical protein